MLTSAVGFRTTSSAGASGAALPAYHRLRIAADLLRPGDLLDVGAASGGLATFAKGSYVATDVDVSAAPSGLPVVAASIEKLPFASETFDVAVCISVLQYVLDVDGALRELRRVVRPGGQVLVLVPNIAYLRNIILLARGRFPWSSVLDDWKGGTIRYFTKHDFVPALEAAGLRVRHITCAGHGHAWRGRFANRLGADLMFDLERVDPGA